MICQAFAATQSKDPHRAFVADSEQGRGRHTWDETTMTPNTETCRRCGVPTTAASGRYAHRIGISAENGETETTLHLCPKCSADFASDQERNEYIRLGLLV